MTLQQFSFFLFAVAVFAMLTLLAGCAEFDPPPSKLIKPSALLMLAPEALPDIAPGDDLAMHALRVRRMYGKETSKLRRLQRYVRTVTK